MPTKFEIELQGRAERALRRDNLRKIDAMIKEAEDLLIVMPASSLEEQHDKRFVGQRLKWLQDMRQDEQRAYDATMTANADDVVNLMRH